MFVCVFKYADMHMHMKKSQGSIIKTHIHTHTRTHTPSTTRHVVGLLSKIQVRMCGLLGVGFIKVSCFWHQAPFP